MFMPDGQLFAIAMHCGVPWGKACGFLSKREFILVNGNLFFFSYKNENNSRF